MWTIQGKGEVTLDTGRRLCAVEYLVEFPKGIVRRWTGWVRVVRSRRNLYHEYKAFPMTLCLQEPIVFKTRDGSEHSYDKLPFFCYRYDPFVDICHIRYGGKPT